MNPSASYGRIRKGFTLLELICVLAVSSMILLIGSMLLSHTTVVARHMEVSDAQYLGGTFTMDYIEREVRSALDIYGPDEYTIGHYDRVSQPIGFILQLAEDKYVTYYRSGTSIVRHTAKHPDRFQAGAGGQGSNAMAGNVSDVRSQIDRVHSIVEVEITLDKHGRTFHMHRLLAIPERAE